MSDKAEKSDLICVGEIAGAYGVNGEVRINSFCDKPSDIANYSPLFDSLRTKYTLKITREIKNGYTANLTNVATREDAEALRGVKLFILRKQLPELAGDEFYHSDLIGLIVKNTDGVELGHVKSIQNYGAGDLLEVYQPEQNKSTYIPFTLAIVPTVNFVEKYIIVNSPDGLF
ncbi:MAG: ribosome maturation factor RimM [Aestuariivita sp.]|nr:ribosome maturation factor RimM [Aestuariivita sp.]